MVAPLLALGLGLPVPRAPAADSPPAASAQVGKFDHGQGEFYAQDNSDGKSTLLRYVWSKITPTSAHFEQAFSEDGGRSWQVNWISDMMRIGDAEDATSSGAGIVGEQPGQRDFEPAVKPICGTIDYCQEAALTLISIVAYAVLTVAGTVLWKRTGSRQTVLIAIGFALVLLDQVSVLVECFEINALLRARPSDTFFLIHHHAFLHYPFILGLSLAAVGLLWHAVGKSASPSV